MNVQHNCHDSDCELTQSRVGFVERTKSSTKFLERTHSNDTRYLINLASLSSPALHRSFSGVAINSKQSLEWINTLHDGLKVWQSVTEKKETKASKKKPAALPEMDPSLR